MTDTLLIELYFTKHQGFENEFGDILKGIVKLVSTFTFDGQSNIATW